jgi:pyruvate/2-oxoglutarate dehydrogenase complex dihydrolipoamide acyltransferase (E2) component
MMGRQHFTPHRSTIMKFLDAKRQAKGVEENKMQPGSRADQDGNAAPFRRGHKANSFDANEEGAALAKELGVDITKVKGSGKDGKITAKDIHAAASANDESGRPPISGFSHTT